MDPEEGRSSPVLTRRPTNDKSRSVPFVFNATEPLTNHFLGENDSTQAYRSCYHTYHAAITPSMAQPPVDARVPSYYNLGRTK